MIRLVKLLLCLILLSADQFLRKQVHFIYMQQAQNTKQEKR